MGHGEAHLGMPHRLTLAWPTFIKKTLGGGGLPANRVHPGFSARAAKISQAGSANKNHIPSIMHFVSASSSENKKNSTAQ